MLGYSIYKLLSTTGYQLLFTQTAGTQRVFPRLYLKAALETIILALIVTWTFTLSWDPNQVWQHPAFITLGAFNFCFAWCAMAYLAPTITSRLSLPLTRLRTSGCGAPLTGTLRRQTTSLSSCARSSSTSSGATQFS